MTREQIAERIMALAQQLAADAPYTADNLLIVAVAVSEGQEAALSTMLDRFLEQRIAALWAMRN